MKIRSIKCAGFRGVRGEVALECPTGFVVIVGRNGSGKSTLCDAIEFALSGTIRASSGHQEKGEGIDDYIWWRGNAPATGRYVELALAGADGETVTIRRTPTEFQVDGVSALDVALCDPESGIEAPLAQLCRTTILHDEDITRLSVDLKETERFDFVRSSLGTADFAAAERRAKELQDLVAAELQRAERLYSDAATRVADVTAQLSHARTEVASIEGLGAAQERLRAFVGGATSVAERLQSDAQRKVTNLRVVTDSLVRLLARLEEVDGRLISVQQPAHVDKIATLTARIASLEAQVVVATQESDRVQEELLIVERQNPANASLALLREHGGRLGLIDGSCPLCASPQSDAAFRTHLEELTRRIARASADVAAIARRATDSAARLSAARAERETLSAQLKALQRAENDILAMRASLVAEAQSLGVVIHGEPRGVSALVSAQISANRTELTEVERALATVNASRSIEQVRSLELELHGVRQKVASAEQRLSKCRSASNQSKEALATIRRVQGEYVSEQLAQLEPLMLELYQRLRPHIDWPEVRYRLRGDVRRMLSLEIGQGLNPSFMFSSGQRRAAGLSFLLAVHLSRKWCRLETLVLDDPVQHIDDYRALHLVEVLAAVRRTGRQILCTVEDDSLGKLLARRLRSATGESGMIVNMSYSSQQGAQVASVLQVSPMPKAILVGA